MQENAKYIFSINQRILQLIEFLGITRYKLSQETGVSETVLLNLSKGKNKPSVDILSKILNRYKVINPTWLLTGEGEMMKEVPLPIAAKPAPVYQSMPACYLCQEKEKVIQAQQQHIDTLQRELHHSKALYDEEREKGHHHSGQKRKVG